MPGERHVPHPEWVKKMMAREHPEWVVDVVRSGRWWWRCCPRRVDDGWLDVEPPRSWSVLGRRRAVRSAERWLARHRRAVDRAERIVVAGADEKEARDG